MKTATRLLIWAIWLLIAFACHATTVVDQSQVFTTGPTAFHWVLTPDYGYQPIDLNGDIVSGLTDGATPWLVDDGYHAPPAPWSPPRMPLITPVQPTTPNTLVTPEPNNRLIAFLAMLVFLGWAILDRQQRGKEMSEAMMMWVFWIGGSTLIVSFFWVAMEISVGVTVLKEIAKTLREWR